MHNLGIIDNTEWNEESGVNFNYFRRGDESFSHEPNMRFVEEWFQHEEVRTIVFKTAV